MAEGDFFIAAIVGFFAGLFFFYKGFIWLKMQRLIENIPTSKIRSLAMGLVEIYGKALERKEEPELKSPFSQKPCVYYRYKIEEYRSSGKSSRWVTVAHSSKGVRFYVKDDTGTVLVDPAGADVDIPADRVIRSGTGSSPPVYVTDFVRTLGVKQKSFLGFNRTMRYSEYYIAPDDKLYILGTAGDNPLVEDATAQMGVEDIMIQKGNNDKIYYISDKGEGDVLKGFKLKTLGGLFGGGILAVVCLAVIMLYLGLF